MRDAKVEELVRRFEERDRLALARLITLVENRDAQATSIMERLYDRGGHALVAGFTGPPGAGKSTLINALLSAYRAMGRTVAVLAVDPSSPFSGGAVLGDRVRMADHFRDAGVYIRSLSSRGSHGGLSRAAREIVRLLDAFGHDVILIETVGVGQTELSIMNLADTTVVVTVPEGGDGIQAMKAGLNEIADIFVVNKADRPGADRLKAELELSVSMRSRDGWQPPVLMTRALQGDGVEALIEALAAHRSFLAGSRDPARERMRREHEFFEVLGAELEERAERNLRGGSAGGLLEAVRSGTLNPYRAARSAVADREVFAHLVADTPTSRAD